MGRRQPEVRSLCCWHLPAALLVVVVLGVLQCRSVVVAQQHYDGETYLCSDSGKTQCDAFALYRAQTSYENLTSIAELFNLKATDLTGLNKRVPVNETLKSGSPVLVPLTCICYNQTSYANVTHRIVSGDTFFFVNAKNFESLSTTNAVINANPTLNYADLQIGTYMVVPVRCACPSLAQINSGVKSLVTYPVVSGDATNQIAASFGVPTQSVVTANELVGANSQIHNDSTLLIPISSTQPNYTAVTGVPSSSSSPAPGSSPSPAPAASSSHHITGGKTGVLYIATAVGLIAGILLS